MKLLTRISRIITGLIFIFSGIVKGVDPLGTAYKLSDYFSAFRLGFLDDLSIPLAVTLCAIEFITGMLLLTGSLTKLASWAAALFMALFTPLTLVLYIFNPITDCGCFGDAIHLTNGQTFFKNIIITLIVVFVFIRRNDPAVTMNQRNGVKAAVAYSAAFLAFIWYNLSYLPVIDFRPYRPGTNIQEAMTLPPDAPADKYDIRFIYEKDGIQKEFTLTDYPANDTTWKFIDQKSVLISTGYVPPVHDFSLATAEGSDITSVILDDKGYTLLMITGKIDKADGKLLKKGFDLGNSLTGQNTGFIVVTSSPASQAEPLTGGLMTLYADETTLKTIIRANPGYVLLHGGTVMAMWSAKSLPEPEKFSADMSSLSISSHYRRITVLLISSFVLIIMLTVSLTSRFRETGN